MYAQEYWKSNGQGAYVCNSQGLDSKGVWSVGRHFTVWKQAYQKGICLSSIFTDQL